MRKVRLFVVKKSVLVLFGGASPEYFVSCQSAGALIDALLELGHSVHALGITQDGTWIHTHAGTEAIADGKTWIEDAENVPAGICLDRGKQAFYVVEDGAMRLFEVDVAFPIIHGSTGEDGRIQGILDIAGIPYVGCGVRSSACCMDKATTMLFAEECGIRTPRYFVCEREDYLEDPDGITQAIYDLFTVDGVHQYPIFVKPASTGSSVGISCVENDEALPEALALAAQYPGKLIVEEGIKGRELKVAVLGNENPEVGAPCEIMVKGDIFNSFELKYESSGSHKIIPADLPQSVVDDLNRHSLNLYRALGCRGFARIDYFVTEDNQVVFNEANTVPGFTAHSVYPLMFKAVGVGYNELVEKLLETGRFDV